MRKECHLFKFLSNGSFRSITSLDLSGNSFTTLGGMHLELLPHLRSLDLRENKFASYKEVTEPLAGCHRENEEHAIHKGKCIPHGFWKVF